MYTLQPEFKNTPHFPLYYSSPLGSTQASFIRQGNILSTPITARSFISEQNLRRSNTLSNLYISNATFGRWPITSALIHSPRSESSRIFNNQKREQVLQKYKSPVIKNMKVINYGPIEVHCARPNSPKPLQLSNRSQTPYFINLKQQQNKVQQANRPIQHLQRLQSKQNIRYHDYTHSIDQSTQSTEALKTPDDVSQNITYFHTQNNTTIVDNNANTSASNKFINLVKQNMIPQQRSKKCIKFDLLQKYEKKKKRKIKDLWVWIACLICCIVLIGLLICL